MALKNLFDMAKADRYTADGREAIIKAQEAETEDVKYQNGDISQKTGLMKTPNGWVEPPKNKEIQNAGKHAESVKAAQKAKKEEARRQQRAEGEANARAFQEKVDKGEIKPAAGPSDEEIEIFKDIIREFKKNPNKKNEQIMNEAKSHLMKNRGMTPEQLGKIGRDVYSEKTKDSAPRQLTGDTRVKVRK